MGALCIFLVVACAFDYWQRRIPNWLLMITAVTGMWISGLEHGTEGMICFACKMLCVITGMYILFKLGTLGAGDVKLFGVCAGYLSGNKILVFLFFSLLIAAGISLIKMILEHNAKDRLIYLAEYIAGVIRTGNWQLYISNKKERQRCSVCLAGPILCSVLMCVGGIY